MPPSVFHPVSSQAVHNLRLGKEGARDYSVQGGGASEALNRGGFLENADGRAPSESRSESTPALLKPRWSFLEAVPGPAEIAPGCEAAMLQTLGA